MKNKFSDYLIAILFCGFLAIMSVLTILLPKRDFSATEKRFLAELPQFTWESLSTGAWGADVETYMADHIPGRDFFVGLNAYVEKLTGRQVAKDIYTAGDRLVEAPVKWDGVLAEKNINKINDFAEAIGKNVDLMIVPSAGWAVSEQVDGPGFSYRDEAYIGKLYEMSGAFVIDHDILSVFSGMDRETLYYRTDHHWTSLGAHTAYKFYMESVGRDFLSAEEFEVETVEGFLGSTYSRSALWLTPGEPLEMWKGSEELVVTNAESDVAHQGPFYPERLAEADKYTVFLDGNHSLVRIENPAAAGKGKLLVIRDSYSNCLGAFLAESYETVVLVDLRYYKSAVSELCAREAFDDILVCYSLSNFLTDTNLSWLR